MSIITLSNLFNIFHFYPNKLDYFIKDENLQDEIIDEDDMESFVEEYGDYEVIDAGIRLENKKDIVLCVDIEK